MCGCVISKLFDDAADKDDANGIADDVPDDVPDEFAGDVADSACGDAADGCNVMGPQYKKIR